MPLLLHYSLYWISEPKFHDWDHIFKDIKIPEHVML